MRLLYMTLLLIGLATFLLLTLQVIVIPTPAHLVYNYTNTLTNTSAISNKTVTTAPEQSFPVEIIQETDLTKDVAAETIYKDDICPNFGKNLKVLIAVISSTSHQNARMAIRQTWGQHTSRQDVAIAFILGTTLNETLTKQIKQEEDLYGDVITGTFIDTYNNLTLKTIFMLEWVDNYCSEANFVLKTDDDMFINVFKLLEFIDKHKPEQQNIYGKLNKKWNTNRIKKSKYYLSPQQYKPSIFPDFTGGAAYVLPARLAKELYTRALKFIYIKLEDVFITGIVANSLNIKRVHAPEFINKRIKPTTCSIQRVISIGHNITDTEQYEYWMKLLDKCKKT